MFSSHYRKSSSCQQGPREGGKILSHNTEVINTFDTDAEETESHPHPAVILDCRGVISFAKFNAV